MKTNTIEKSLFSFTRIFAALGALFFLLIAIFAIIAFFFAGKNTTVSYEDIKKSLIPPSAEAQVNIEDTLPGIHVPDAIKETFTGDNLPILYEWLNPLDNDNKQDFLNNLSNVISKAKKNNDDPITIINQYKVLKQAKLASSDFEKYFDKVIKAIYISLAVFAFIIAILFCLILVLLAIERNTRNQTT